MAKQVAVALHNYDLRCTAKGDEKGKVHGERDRKSVFIQNDVVPFKTTHLTLSGKLSLCK